MLTAAALLQDALPESGGISLTWADLGAMASIMAIVAVLVMGALAWWLRRDFPTRRDMQSLDDRKAEKETLVFLTGRIDAISEQITAELRHSHELTEERAKSRHDQVCRDLNGLGIRITETQQDADRALAIAEEARRNAEKANDAVKSVERELGRLETDVKAATGEMKRVGRQVGEIRTLLRMAHPKEARAAFSDDEDD